MLNISELIPNISELILNVTVMQIPVQYFLVCSGRADPKLLRSHNVCDLPVQALPEVDDDAYPPQQKSFAMFRWMEDHVGSRWEEPKSR